MATTSERFFQPSIVFSTAILLRLGLLIYGHWLDAHSPVKYTDVDYLVFTDAARFVAQGGSPYERATYRYTPLLAWILYPTTWGGLWFDFGKVLFAAGDIVTGWLIMRILVVKNMDSQRALKFASIWLLNPMVANISTRGSSEGLVVAIVIALLHAVVTRRYRLAGALLGLGVHVKIYPFIYAASIFWALDSSQVGSLHWSRNPDEPSFVRQLKAFVNPIRYRVALIAFVVTTFSLVVLQPYGLPAFKHTYLYHFTRIDHRHNFSVYNTALHLNSARQESAGPLAVERLAFLPQLLLSAVALPICLAKKDLPSTMLVQTFAFVTFNKVCTSQYFLWYLVFLPFYLPNSSMLRRPWLGGTALLLWVVGQAVWLQQGYELEFLGRSTFYPGLWAASILFFGINCWILGVMIDDIRSSDPRQSSSEAVSPRKTR